MNGLRLLAVAINTKRMGYVFFVGHQLKDWRSMTKPTKSQCEAAAAMQRLINDFQPDVVVTEKTVGTKSPAKSELLKAALSRTTAQNYVLDVCVERTHDYANKYEEAEVFGRQYPELQPFVPPARRSFDHQPARLILFDAIAIAHKVFQRPSTTIAQAML